ncbi:hypothetical protein [Adhaeribacter rhizoryzae]|uniref:hypothetical protein n=1 Tax=Adhaeribacter rhizoryzae TaxID=2607907 RepID=UPI001CC1D6C7|nr:hypothetical protein [Adhaeribacter rhizoryzae]
MAVISEDGVKRYIVPHLSISKRGSKLKVETAHLLAAIISRLKQAVSGGNYLQKELLNGNICWQGVYHHFRKWPCEGSLTKAWVELLKSQRRLIELSSVQLDGSQTICKNGGESIGYQTRKVANSCNCLF